MILKRIQKFLTWIGRNLHFAKFQFITHESIKGKNESHMNYLVSLRFMGFIQMHIRGRRTVKYGGRKIFFDSIRLKDGSGRRTLKSFSQADGRRTADARCILHPLGSPQGRIRTTDAKDFSQADGSGRQMHPLRPPQGRIWTTDAKNVSKADESAPHSSGSRTDSDGGQAKLKKRT